ncbi:hypothetical protein [uncultured Arcticibacterium sp.]|uniref:hypothetical protein n=1 Tax=uncultured Arcticibacterium sp. TaxID=2173042 RepID=UPI0030F63733
MRNFKLLSLVLLISVACQAQNWNKVDSVTPNSNVTDTVWRSGPVLISDYLTNPSNNKFGVVAKYDSTNNRGIFISLNEPDDYTNEDGDSTRVGLVLDAGESHAALVANNYANFHESVANTDVHNSTSEFNYFRGFYEGYGFRDGGAMERAATLRLSGAFGNNGRAYSNNQYDLLNLRFFTSSTPDNLATITNFYAVRMEDFRGVNVDMIENGWGIYMKPNVLDNFFGGKVGIGVDSPTAALSIVSDTLNPLSLSGLKVDTAGTDLSLMSVDAAGVVHSKSLQSLNENFMEVLAAITLDNDTFLYVHKGGDVIYTLPAANTRTGKTWKIVNIGSGSITFSESYYEGNETRDTLTNKAGAYSIELFSDGTNYIAIK